MKLADRLVFGTARLSGGAYARESRQLLEDCLAAGVRQFDTAPSYGMGAAEGLIGEVTDGDPSIRVHTKAGLARPSFPATRGWAKRAFNLIRPRRSSDWNPLLIDYTAPPPGVTYEAAAIENSITRSRELLRRECLDLLLLHAAEPGDVDVRIWQVFQDARKAGSATQIGFAHFGPPRCSNDGIVAQVAPRVADFHKPTNYPRVLHSIRSAALLAARASTDLADRLQSEQRALGTDASGASGEFVAALALLARVQPQAGLVFATTSRTKLAEMLELASRVELPDATLNGC